MEENKYLEDKLADMESRHNARTQDSVNYAHIGIFIYTSHSILTNIGLRYELSNVVLLLNRKMTGNVQMNRMNECFCFEN